MEQWFYSASPAERQRRREEVRARFRAADRDGDGQLDRTEWRAVLTRSGVPATESVAIASHSNTLYCRQGGGGPVLHRHGPRLRRSALARGVHGGGDACGETLQTYG